MTVRHGPLGSHDARRLLKIGSVQKFPRKHKSLHRIHNYYKYLFLFNNPRTTRLTFLANIYTTPYAIKLY